VTRIESNRNVVSGIFSFSRRSWARGPAAWAGCAVGLVLGCATASVAADPGPWRLAHPSRSLYTFLQMPQNTFLAVIILGASVPLYRHYATLQIPWPGWTATALDDQRLAAGIMWVGGDLLFIGALAIVVWGWMRAEEANTARADKRADAELAAIRARETALAERRAEEAGPAKG